MIISLVVAVAESNVIGAGGTLAWRISDDLKWFKQQTIGKPVIMGRKTYDSIGKALPGRDNIVVTRNKDFVAENIIVEASVEAAISRAQKCAGQRAINEVCVIGGGEIYAQALPVADRIYLTRVNALIEGDVFFPALDSAEWDETLVSTCEITAKNQFACEFFILNRQVK